jgi:hypothetical protein
MGPLLSPVQPRLWMRMDGRMHLSGHSASNAPSRAFDFTHVVVWPRATATATAAAAATTTTTATNTARVRYGPLTLLLDLAPPMI